MFLRNWSEKHLPELDIFGYFTKCVMQVTNLLYDCVSSAKCLSQENHCEVSQGGWERLLGDNDDLKIRKAEN